MAVDPDKPFNREEMYLAKAAGEGTTVPDEPWSRKEAYLDKISGRMDGIDEKIAALATDISLKGGVDSYADLPEDAEIGDAYITEDTGILYVWVGDEWTPLNMQGGGGGVTTLTTADYNWPATGTKMGLAHWLLEPGNYKIDNSQGSGDFTIYLDSTTTGKVSAGAVSMMTVSSYIAYNDKEHSVMEATMTATGYPGTWLADARKDAPASESNNGRVIKSSYIVDNLNSLSTVLPLSANQGRLLNEKFGGMQLMSLTQAEYDNLPYVDPTVLYIIKAN